ncbi:MAG: M56 family metallopeptidase [Ginsengibacter sp.]
MPAFQNSPFLMALGWAIANNVWQAGLLWLTYQLIGGFNVKQSAKYKNAVSTSLVFVSFIWFVYTLATKLISAKSASDLTFSQTNVFETSSMTATYDFEYLFSALRFSLPYFSVAYIILIAVLFIKFFKAYNASVFIRKHGIVPATEQWLHFTEKVASKIRISRKVSIWFSTYINVPATVGFLKPVILVPIASINQLSTEQLEAIILHELAHIQRNDYLLNILISAIETILFFNPFIVLLVKVLKRERENCCDDLVIHYKYDRHSYASALVSIEKTRLNNYPLAMSATSGKNQLLNRVKRIVDNGKEIKTFNYGQRLLTLLVITAVMISVSWIYPTHQTKKIINSASSVPGKIQPEQMNSIQTEDAESNLTVNIETKKTNKKKSLSTNIKSVIVPETIQGRTRETKEAMQHISADKAILTLQKLKALVEAKKSDMLKGHNFNLTFNMNEDFKEFKNDLSWSYTLPEENFDYLNSADFDRAIDALLLPSKELNYTRQALIAKQYLLDNLSEQYLKQATKFKNALDEREVLKKFRNIKLDSLVIRGDKANDFFPEKPVPVLERKAFEKLHNRVIVRSKDRQPLSEVNRVAFDITKTKLPTKKVSSNSTQTPLTINFNGEQIVLNSDGISLKKSGKQAKPNSKKVVLAFGDGVVHLNIDTE